MNPIKTNTPHKMGVFTLTMITSALFMTLRNMPVMAETGMQMLFLNFITVFAFLIPVALVSAELATGWPHNGVYHWIREAFSEKIGWLAVWLQWSQSIFGVTSILAYAAASFSFLINPDLASNKYFIVLIILVVYWGATFANLHGTKLSGIISSVCVISGVFIPTIALIVLSIIYVSSGHPGHLDISFTAQNYLPSIHDSRYLGLFLSFIFGFVGIEVSASHAREVESPHKNYPIAIFSAAIIGFILTLLGGMAIAIVIPVKDINLVSGAMQTFSAIFKTYNLSWLTPLAAFLVAFGAAGQVSTWIVGPVKGIFAAGKAGNLPPIFRRENSKGVPKNLLILQAVLISTIALLFLLFTNVQTGFLVLTSIAVLLYSIMYIIMFVAAIRLRYTHPDTPRPNRFPGGNLGNWLNGGMGLITVFVCFLIGFIPPPTKTITILTYESVMMVGVGLLVALPLCILRKRTRE